MDQYLNTSEINHTFSYPASSDFSELKQLSGLEYDGNQTVYQNAVAIINFAHSMFAHDGNSVPSVADPLTIFKEAQAGGKFRCVEYSILAAGLLWAVGIPARTLGLKMQDVETREYGAGHVVIEFWESDLAKWIMADVQAGVIIENEDTPLSAAELRIALERHELLHYNVVASSSVHPLETFDEAPNYLAWLRPYLYFIDTPAHLTLKDEDRSKQQIVMLVPLDASAPKSFQGLFEMNALYTHSLLDFYPPYN